MIKPNQTIQVLGTDDWYTALNDDTRPPLAQWNQR